MKRREVCTVCGERNWYPCRVLREGWRGEGRADRLVGRWPLFQTFSIVKSASGPLTSTPIFKLRLEFLSQKLFVLTNIRLASTLIWQILRPRSHFSRIWTSTVCVHRNSDAILALLRCINISAVFREWVSQRVMFLRFAQPCQILFSDFLNSATEYCYCKYCQNCQDGLICQDCCRSRLLRLSK